MPLSIINHPLVWRRALTLGKLHVVSKSVGLSGLSVDLLLVVERLLELHLLLHLLLLIRQDRVLALVRLERVRHVYHVRLLLHRRHIH